MEPASLSQEKPREKTDINHGAPSITIGDQDQDIATVDSINSTQIQRHFISSNQDPFLTVEWSKRDARAGNFFQADVEFPTSWSDSAIGIVSKLYFATVDGVRESSLKTLVERVVCKIVKEGLNFNYFGDENDLEQLDKLQVFKDELTYILLHQMASFNSPVWFNIGVPGRKQTASACYLMNVEDHLLGDESITEWISNEAAIFKSGGGSGVNLSKLRGSTETLSTGGISSGPVSFMRAADASAGSIKSGGTRRAAKLICLDVDHPDILDFIDSKVREDKRMRVLAEAGINMDPSTKEGEKNIAECTSFQNANISVRLSDKFMRCVERNEFWQMPNKNNKGPLKTLGSRELLKRISEATWQSADPGIMFDDTINAWHTTPSLGKIETSNPCCEVHTNNNSSCNLTSLNLVKFLNDDNSFAFDDFYQTVDIMITAMDITCSFSDLPTKKLEENTRNLRQLGLGYSNLGAALMIQGMPYDSDEGRDWAASVTSLMTGRAYRRSAELASQLGPFLHYEENEDAMDDALIKHYNWLPNDNIRDGNIWEKSFENWNEFIHSNDGYRNSQISVLAPTGTISFMMDCDTTGCEPAYSLVSYKKLAAGGSMTLVNKSVARSLETQGFLKSEIKKIEENGLTHPIFYSPQFQTAAGENSISPDGHIKMLAAIQPHLSGAISKTVNLPESATVKDIYNLYIEAWKLGIKCVAVYRDGSKSTQVLSTKKDSIAQNSTEDKASENVEQDIYDYTTKTIINKDQIIKSGLKGLHKLGPIEKIKEQIENPLFKLDNNEISKVSSRKKMPQERKSITNKFSIGEYEGYITAGMYEDGTLGEIFLNGIGKEGSTLRGVMDALAMSISIGLQHGVPLETLAQKFSHMDFEPKGLTNNPEIRVAKSMPDYIMRWLVSKFGDDDLCEELGIRKEKTLKQKELDMNQELDYDNKVREGKEKHKLYLKKDPEEKLAKDYFAVMEVKSVKNGDPYRYNIDHGKACVCGSLMNRVGTCWSCRSCGASTGCS